VTSLNAAGYRTVGDLAAADARQLADRFGAWGLRLHQLAHGQDARAVNPDEDRKGVSNETTFMEDIRDLDRLEDKLWAMCEKTGRRCREAGVAGRVVVLKLKTADFRLLTRRRTLPVPVQTARGLFAAGRELLAKEANGAAYRLIGIGVADLVEAAQTPADFFGEGERRALSGEKAVDALRAKFGQDAIVSGRALKGR
jgi:DNA polymerase IV